eukprot:484052-Hanusia_phi.AAC.1
MVREAVKRSKPSGNFTHLLARRGTGSAGLSAWTRCQSSMEQELTDSNTNPATKKSGAKEPIGSSINVGKSSQET